MKPTNQPCDSPPASGRRAQPYARRIKSWLYFATAPYGNYAINLVWHRRFTRSFIPKVLYLETTNHCNAHCIMCPHDKMTRPRGQMPWALFTKIIDECATFEGRGLRIFLHKDGEPLLDPLLFDRIRYVKQKLGRSRVHFNTNASLLDAAKAEQILQSPLDSMVLSVDGASPETYGKIRVGLQYEIVKANIEQFFEKKRARPSQLEVIMQMVVGRENHHEVKRYRELWEGRADRIVFKPMHNFLVQGTALHGGAAGNVQRQRCSMPFHVMLIYANGDVGLCCWDFDNIARLGNVRESDLLAVYNQPGFAAIRRAMRAGDCAMVRPCNMCSQIYGQDGPMWAAGWNPEEGD